LRNDSKHYGAGRLLTTLAAEGESKWLQLMKKMDLDQVFHSDREIMGETPVFTGTRVPVQNLVDYLEGGESIDDFLLSFPTVKREQVIAFIKAAKDKLLLPA
jgi:uncharacterized protein (DUF433 family)